MRANRPRPGRGPTPIGGGSKRGAEASLAPNDFARAIHDLLNHFYDPAYVQTHPLAQVARNASESPSKPAGQILRRDVLVAIESLRASSEDVRAKKGRCFQILAWRYVDGLSIEDVRVRLSVSHSTYYREYHRGVQAIVSLLRSQWGDVTGPPDERGRVQLIRSDLGVADPAVGRAVDVPLGISAHLTKLIGREREIADVRRLLSTSRLVTLTGTGGIGKTSLALQVAANVSEEYPNGVSFVSLAPIAAATSVVPTIAQVVEVKESADQPLVESLTGALRARQMLLVLDNFEHVAGAAGDVATLMGACPKLTILVTSRSPLHLRGEHESPVPPLDVPDHRVHRDQVLQTEAVRLFAERARAVRPDFAVTDRNAATVAEICRRLDGLPLAIELAAGRIKTLSPTELLDRLEARLRILIGGARDLPARQQTLRSTIAWSYQLLSEEESRLFRRLAVFVGGFTLESAAVVCGGAPLGDYEAEFVTLDLLDGLVDQSLIHREASDGDATRFTMLETIREYAGEMLAESGEAAAIARAHALYFHARVAGEESFVTLDDTPVPVTWLERERPNILAALRWFRDKDEAAHGLRLSAAAWNLWSAYGPRAEGREWLTTFLRMTADGPGTLARASALHSAGLSAIAQGDPDAARADLDEGLTIAHEFGDPFAEAEFLGAIVMMETDLGNLAAARLRFETALTLLRNLANRDALTSLLVHGGDLAGAEGDEARARSLYEESLAVGAMPEWSLRMLTFVALRDGDVSAARTYLQESFNRYRRLGFPLGLMECLNAFAGIALAQERRVKAGRLLGAVAALLRTVIGGRLHSRDRTENERFLAAARVSLGVEGFALAWAEGQAMTLEQAIEFALGSEPE